MSNRFASFEEFWPYYLSEHKNPQSRRLHFVGTTGWMASCVASSLMRPVAFPMAMVGFGAALAHGSTKEPQARPLGHIALMLGLPSLASPLFPAGVAFAYACAWLGHFGIEKNVPATFEYPLWSFLGDLKMWSHMIRGRLWSGDPLAELGLTAPSKPGPTRIDDAARAVVN